MARNNSPQEILTVAIERWRPVAISCLFSAGYDSMVATHLLHSLDTHGLPVKVWSIDTNLAADGWHGFVGSVAERYGWDFDIYDNWRGFQQFVTLVAHLGCPKGARSLHTNIYQKLKERGIDAIHMDNKRDVHDKSLFVSGMRRAESDFRSAAAEVYRIGKSNKIFASPIVHWSNQDCDLYRASNDLPDNPFYDTVKGSGDCQCNWGDFITLETLREHSPNLAAGNVAFINCMSLDLHGFGWHSQDYAGQEPLVSQTAASAQAKLTTPFLCQGCSRSKVRAPAEKVENVMFQRGLF